MEHLHKESEKSGLIRRKDFDELKILSAQRQKELLDKCERLTAINSRLKSNNERLDGEIKHLKTDNKILTERMDEIVRNSKRREGNTWREINRIVDQVTDAPTDKVEAPIQDIKPRKPVVKVRVLI